mgnify:CR=1 FL=1|tara:strand:+ start:1295 stop:1585 length:291 start_codon:yes stop_codon:yes gene_type:complete
MSYNPFKNRETWLLAEWGYADEIANVWITNEHPHGAVPSSISEDYCRDSFMMCMEETYSTLPHGIIKEYVDAALAKINWHEVLIKVKDTISEELAR